MKITKNKKILILSFFVFVWGFFIIYGYERYQELNNKNDEIISFNKQFGIQEDILPNSSYLNDVASGFKENDNFLGKIANAEEKNLFVKDDSILKDDSSETENLISNLNSKLICGSFKCYSVEEFIELYNDFEKSTGLTIKDESIYNDEVDPYIRYLAGLRGYKKRIFADEKDIIDFYPVRTRKEVRDAYISMRNKMKKQNLSLHIVSGYRSANHQRNIFKNKLGYLNNKNVLDGLYDEKINKVLTKSSIPGYSKHHSGYAVDFGCGNDYLVYSFAKTNCYDWLSENNFENAKRFGFIPSYPYGIDKQGPDPEPWEFVWIGKENIK